MDALIIVSLVAIAVVLLYLVLLAGERAVKAIVRLFQRENGQQRKEVQESDAATKKSTLRSKVSSVMFFYLEIFLMWLAEQDVFFTKCKEGTVKAIMKGGSLDHFIMSFAGYHLNDPRKNWYRSTDTRDGVPQVLQQWEVKYHGPNTKRVLDEVKELAQNNETRKPKDEELDSYYDDRRPLPKKLGLYWVGRPWVYSVYVYPFAWNETETEQESGIEKILPRAEPTDFIYVADFTYAIKTDSAETKDRLPVDVLTFVTVAIRNPYRALFSGEDWIQRVTSVVNRHVRNFVGSQGYDDLVTPIKKTKDEAAVTMQEVTKAWAAEFSGPIIDLTKKLPDDDGKSQPPYGLRDRYGVVIRTADLQTIAFAGTPAAKQKLLDAATKTYTAIKDAEAAVLKGTADGDVIEIKGKKEAVALKERLITIENSPAGQLLAQLDAIQESSKNGGTIVWANDPLIAAAKFLNSAKKEKEVVES